MRKNYLILFVLLSACSNLYQANQLSDLKGKTSKEVLSILGKPVSERKEGKYAKMWAYFQQECSTLVFFDNQDFVQYAERRGNCYFKMGEK